MSRNAFEANTPDLGEDFELAPWETVTGVLPPGVYELRTLEDGRVVIVSQD